MVRDTEARQPDGEGGGAFHTTRWSRIARAGRPDDPGAAEALEQLCQAYWYPVYSFVRRCGQSATEAEDTVQAFFAKLLEKNYVAQADPERGRFRTFLLAALKHHLTHQREHARAVKRGGRFELVSLDGEEAEQLFSREPATEETPESIYERRWAETMLEHALWRLRAEFDGGGKVERFDRLKPFLMRQKEASYRETAEQLGLSEGALKSAIHRLRERFVQILREEIGQTVATASDIDAEIRYQLGLLAR
ncbi:MAG: sigma-70 family RNA polymerase sigma factor [Verrucomicrobiales bacterium]|jgi:RNA polymerase sigma factor (sigma-70 family)|nr:sigma-70 family RNA polymerase sigma factor [Verrucomicrobiales bacterium]